MTKAAKKTRPRKTALKSVIRKGRLAKSTSRTTKKAQLISILSKDTGADVAGISKKFGWLPHTTRAALSRLRKVGYPISSAKSGPGQPTKYRITSIPAEQNAQ